MTDAVKKTTKKTPTKAKTPAKAKKEAAATNGYTSNVTQMRVPHDQIATLAHRYWNERGQQHGHHEEDWYRAEEELRGKAS